MARFAGALLLEDRAAAERAANLIRAISPPMRCSSWYARRLIGQPVIEREEKVVAGPIQQCVEVFGVGDG